MGDQHQVLRLRCNSTGWFAKVLSCMHEQSGSIEIRDLRATFAVVGQRAYGMGNGGAETEFLLVSAPPLLAAPVSMQPADA